LFIAACNQPANDFDVVCNYFYMLKIKLEKKELSPSERYTFITELINNNLSESSDARISWHAIVNLKAGKRYGMFIVAAEASLEQSWECKSMSNLIENIEG